MLVEAALIQLAPSPLHGALDEFASAGGLALLLRMHQHIHLDRGGRLRKRPTDAPPRRKPARVATNRTSTHNASSHK